MDSQQVLGRVVDVEMTFTVRDETGNTREVNKSVPVMQTKIATSSDISAQRLKPFNQKEICGRFPGAWEAYEKAKAKAAPQEEIALDGTTIDKADFIPSEKRAWLKASGLVTVEQLCGMSDAQLQNLGPGARTWQKKAKLLLSAAA